MITITFSRDDDSFVQDRTRNLSHALYCVTYHLTRGPRLEQAFRVQGYPRLMDLMQYYDLIIPEPRYRFDPLEGVYDHN